MDEVDVCAPCARSVCVCAAVGICLKLQAECNQGQETTESQNRLKRQRPSADWEKDGLFAELHLLDAVALNCTVCPVL